MANASRFINGDIVEGTIRLVQPARQSPNGYDQVCMFVQTKTDGLIRVFQTLGTENEYAWYPSFRAFLFEQAGVAGSENLKDLAGLTGQSVICMAEAYVGDPDEVTGISKEGISFSVLAWIGKED